MSQVYVERVIGLLATDECLRHRFIENPHATLLEMVEGGMELNPGELRSLARVDPHELRRFARSIDPRLQKSDLRGEGDPRPGRVRHLGRSTLSGGSTL
jgi:hypothetical protein